MKNIIIATILILGMLLCGTLGYMIIEKKSVLESFYMTVITISTVGFGEVFKLSLTGRIFTILLIFSGISIGGYTIVNLTAFLIEGHIRDLFRSKKMEKEITRLKNHIVVCGYGRTGSKICDLLHENKKKFIIIDRNEAAILEAHDKKFLIIHGDATDDEVLKQSGVAKASSLITSLGNNADNVYVVLTAREMNKNLRIIARSVDEASCKKLVRAGADKTVSPFSIAGRRMAYLATRPEIVEFLEVMTQSSEIELKLEQVRLCKKSQLINKKLNQSNIKSETNGAMIIGIKKSGIEEMVVNPPGEMILKEGDILMALGNDSQLAKLKEISEKKWQPITV